MLDALPWKCLELARTHLPSTRLPVMLCDQHGSPVPIGSVSRAHVAAICSLAGADAVRETDTALHLPWSFADPGLCEAALGRLNLRLRDAGLIVAWRDEAFPVWPLGVEAAACARAQGDAGLPRFERAAARFWGTVTLGAHCNGYVSDAFGRPHRLWIARRSPLKATDPGLLDNLVGGGVPAGQTPLDTLRREGWEEAGLDSAQLASAVPGNIQALCCDIREGLQREYLYAYDLALPPDFRPINQDGEVESFTCMTVEQALEAAGLGLMTVDAALVTLDFGLRHGLLGAHASALAERQRRSGVMVTTEPPPIHRTGPVP